MQVGASKRGLFVPYCTFSARRVQDAHAPPSRTGTADPDAGGWLDARDGLLAKVTGFVTGKSR